MAANRFRLSALIVALYCLSCARMLAPPGGPEDKTAPAIALTIPAQDATNVSRDTDVVLEFSEPVNRPGVEASLYLSPEPGRRLRYRWSGRRLTLDYLDPLPENRTIVVTVGAQAKDLQGNLLENSFTLAFSTGDSIDRGEVSGLVALPEASKSFGVVAYILGDTLPDPMVDTPDYRIQTTAQGTFSLPYLAKGRYRLFALDDRNFDGLWAPAAELIGPANKDVEVQEGLKPFVTFSPSLHDTTPPAILRVRQVNEHQIDVRVNHSGQPLVEISDGVTTQFAEHFREDTSATGSWHIYFPDTVSGDSATLSVRVLNPRIPDSSLTSRYAVNNRPDTTAPELSYTVPDDRSMIRYVPQEILAIFTEPIVFSEQTDSVKAILRVDTIEVSFAVFQSDPVSITLIPDAALTSDGKCSVEIPTSLVTDYSGNAPYDSLLKFSWYSYPEDSLGTISGVIRATAGAQWLVELYSLGNPVPAETFVTFSDFSFVKWPAGDYRIRVIQDVNRNERYDLGSILPFEFSEPFAWHPDTISIRPRWTNEVEFFWTTETQP